MNREFKFDIEQVDEGQFWGVAAVYNNIDLGSDMIQRGAFTKTISDNYGKVPLLLDHRIPIGIAMIEDSEIGLRTHGKLNLDKEVGRDAYSDLKFYKDVGKPYGMSIGYQVEKKKKEGDIRLLTEVRLFETSITITPMNPLARVADVKEHLQNNDVIESFIAALKAMREGDPQRYQDALAEFKILLALPGLAGTSNEAAPAPEQPEAAAPQEPEPEALHSEIKSLFDTWSERLTAVA